MTRTVPLSYTINVSVSTAPQGLGEYNTNTVCLFTNEQPLSTEPYIWAVNTQDAINEYGTNSLTAKMAQALFTPVPNLRTGNGQVLIFPYAATNATAGSTTTIAITNTIISALQLVTNGDLTLTIDGTDYTASGLNFSNINAVADIVSILKNQYLDCDIEVANTNTIRFTSRNYGTTSAVALKATTGGSGTDIYGSTYLDGANQVTIAGTAQTGTTLAEAIAQAEEVAYFGGILTTQILDNDGIEATARAVQDKDPIYYEAIQSLKNIGTLGNAIKTAGNKKTRLLAKTDEGAEIAKTAIATYCTIAQSTNYSGVNTALTMNLKELTGIKPDSNINSTYYNLAKQNGVDIYANTEGLACVYSFDNGYYTDDATNLLWIKKALEVSGFNYLRKTNTKIPQTEVGMVGLKNAYETRCSQGVANGVIGTGLQWNDSIPFGNPADFQRNIEEKGYYIYSLPIAKQSQAEREERIAPLVQIAIKLSGAIHSSNLIVQVQR
jgi:hypothetical protein